MAVEIPLTESLKEEELGVIERHLGCVLPSDYRTFLQAHDGAVPSDNIFSTTDNESGVRSFVPAAELVSLRNEIDGFPTHAVPIAEDGCGNYVWLDPASGWVHFWDHEIETDGERIADNFTAFLALLRPFDPASVVLSPGQVISVWIDPDFKPEF